MCGVGRQTIQYNIQFLKLFTKMIIISGLMPVSPYNDRVLYLILVKPVIERVTEVLI